MVEKPKIIILRETFWESLASDFGSALTLIAVVSLGVWLESDALQWIGGVVGIIALGLRIANGNRRMTIAEARAYLDDLDTSGNGGG